MDYKEDFKISPLGPPFESGVYCVIAFNSDYKEEILYIGSSKNIHKRVMSPNHLYRKLYNSLSNLGLYICTGSMITDDYRNKEIEMIKKHKPILNVRHT